MKKIRLAKIYKKILPELKGCEKTLSEMGYETKTAFPQHLTTWASKKGNLR
jgi:hypothetical protein